MLTLSDYYKLVNTFTENIIHTPVHTEVRFTVVYNTKFLLSHITYKVRFFKTV